MNAIVWTGKNEAEVAPFFGLAWLGVEEGGIARIKRAPGFDPFEMLPGDVVHRTETGGVGVRACRDVTVESMTHAPAF